MSSVPRPSAGAASELPFASYAQVIRMLVPPAERIGFYDALGHALWINDGVDEPDFRMHVELVLARARQGTSTGASAASQPGDDTAFVFILRNTNNLAVGAIGIACRNLAAGARFRSAEAVERMLAPVMAILGHAWPATAKVVPIASAAQLEAGTRQATIAATQLNASMPVPAMLRKTLSLATNLIDCAFGAVVLPERAFTLSHCVSAEESDLSITAAVDNVRSHVLRWMKTRNETLVVNAIPGRHQQLPYKLLVVPVRNPEQRIVALLMLFRSKRARDFAGVDIDELTQLATRVPTSALTDMLAPEAPVIASVVTLPQPTPKPQQPQPVPVAVKRVTPAPTPVPAVIARPTAPRQPAGSPKPVAPRVEAPVVPQKMDDRVRAALRLGSFDLYAQKIESIRESTESPRFEVLLRMREANQLHNPTTFFPAAESSRLLPDLDCWVINELLSTLRKRATTVRTSCLEFSVNVTGQSLATAQFGEFIVAEVCRTAIPAGLLVFEVSEKTVLEHEDDMNELSARLRDVGCRIALDNCRSGLGTLDPFNKWPVSRVKIDGSLIRGIGMSQRAESQVRTLAQMAADRGIETVAECVETQRIRDRLLDLGIDFAQGFHLAKPQPLQSLFG